MRKVLEKGVRVATPRIHVKERYKFFLKGHALFSAFSSELLDRILERSMVKNCEKGKMIFLLGDEIEFFYVVMGGWVKLFRETRDGHESVISLLTRGGVFGEAALLKNRTSLCNAEAITESVFLLIPTGFMLEMAEDHANFGSFFEKLLEYEMEKLSQRELESEHLAQMTSSKRVGCFLLRLCETVCEGQTRLHLPYEKSLVAGRLGMTPETFSRSLHQLAGLGVETKGTMVTIRNMRELRRSICAHCSATKKECWLSEDEGDSK